MNAIEEIKQKALRLGMVITDEQAEQVLDQVLDKVNKITEDYYLNGTSNQQPVGIMSGVGRVSSSQSDRC